MNLSNEERVEMLTRIAKNNKKMREVADSFHGMVEAIDEASTDAFVKSVDASGRAAVAGFHSAGITLKRLSGGGD